MDMWGLKYFFQLRYLQTLNNISQENNSTIVFPVPIDIISEMMRGDSKERSKVTNTHLLTGNRKLCNGYKTLRTSEIRYPGIQVYGEWGRLEEPETKDTDHLHVSISVSRNHD